MNFGDVNRFLEAEVKLRDEVRFQGLMDFNEIWYGSAMGPFLEPRFVGPFPIDWNFDMKVLRRQ